MKKMEQDIAAAVKSTVSEGLFAIKYNLSRVFGGLLYSLKLEMEKEDHVGVIDKLVSLVISTSKYVGPFNEAFPAWDEKEAEELLTILRTALQKHGIKGVPDGSTEG